jgi:aspartate ammonia-lyase
MIGVEVERYRIEHDLIGEMQMPADAFLGIHTVRSLENFPLAQRPVQNLLDIIEKNKNSKLGDSKMMR